MNSESIGKISNLSVKFLKGLFMYSQNCNISISNSTFKNLALATFEESILSFHKSAVVFDSVTLGSISILTDSLYSKPIIAFDDTT